MPTVTEILNSICCGNARESEKLVPLVYEELRKLAHARMAVEFPGQTLQPTALVHEAYLRLIGDAQVQWDGRGHFFAAAAEAMRRILIDRARHRRSKRAGGEHQRIEWTENLPAMVPEGEDQEERLLKLDQALCELEKYDSRKAKLVKMRFFAGLTNKQAADALGISVATADRDWSFAKAWLQRQIDA